MMPEKLEVSTKKQFRNGSDVQEWRSFFDAIPAGAKISVTHFSGDQREGSLTTVTATWRQ